MTVGTRPGARRGPARAGARAEASGAASTALRAMLGAQRRPARVLAAFPAGLYLEVRTELEPHVVAVVSAEATRLPNAMVLTEPLPPVAVGDEAAVGDGSIEVGGLSLRVRRWWNPAPPLGPAYPPRLESAASVMTRLCLSAARRPGLERDGAVALLAEGCATGSLADTIVAAERLVGLGPGLTPSGDDVLAGLLLALRHLGQASDTGRAIWLAGWLSAAVTFEARSRTTPISATLLHCASRGQASSEVLAVLRGIAGHQALEPALLRLLQLGHTSGADLAWGLRIGLDAVLGLRDRAA
ncbi:hypothetical protein Misp01_27990 [Microtetraspora sp. NBRC 13810]|uniref:DUF2877 domain-containing protein n=1 Tax=Microtetraspora sp. NBRC 13810 TaxID=3030990 RepID=UPI0024A411E0|nr:DUF2877 domain-containing protein [Microtetraspora sp. NBRC 13810]GLW07669.1 hypothetical protein Misp01_27990 [Microtetraspora sp. NBRC 13810]